MIKSKLLASLDAHVRKTVTEQHGQTDSNYSPEWEWLCERLAELYPIDYKEKVKEIHPTAECIISSRHYCIWVGMNKLSWYCISEQSAWRNAFDNILKLTHEKQTSETQATKDPIGTGQRE